MMQRDDLEDSVAILCIEDDESLSRLIRTRLERLNYRVVLASDGHEGIAKMEGDLFDLILLDYKLPGMDGLEVMRRIQERENTPPVVILSGYGNLNMAVQAIRLGAADYVIKEVDHSYFELLEGTISRVLDKSRLERDKRRVERALEDKKTLLESTQNHIDQGLCVFDGYRKLVTWNQKYITLFQLNGHDIKAGTNLTEIVTIRYARGDFGDRSLEEAQEDEARALGQSGDRIYECQGPGGMELEARVTDMPGGGRVATYADISQRKLAEQALRDSEDRYRRLSEFASSVIHNVGNILSSINVSCGTVYKDLTQSKLGQLHKACKLLRDNAHIPDYLSNDPKGKLLPDYLSKLTGVLEEERLDNQEEIQGVLKNLMLITQIIEYQQSEGRRDELNEMLDLQRVVEDAIRVKTDAILREGVTIRNHVDGGLLVMSQKGKLTHVLINLIKNAVEAMANSPSRVLTMRGHRNEQSQVILSILDTGTGIEQDQIKDLFTYGFTTKVNGHGFGLHYCAAAAREMGCTLDVHSDGPGEGATFTLTFSQDDLIPGEENTHL